MRTDAQTEDLLKLLLDAAGVDEDDNSHMAAMKESALDEILHQAWMRGYREAVRFMRSTIKVNPDE